MTVDAFADSFLPRDAAQAQLGTMRAVSAPDVRTVVARIDGRPVSGAMVVARVVMKTKCGAEEIIDHCARNLAPYKVPRRIEFCEAI